jgi:hypothetical protein
MPTCPATGKQQYTQRLAVSAAIVRSRAAGRPMRVYKCPFCRRFHLTSQPRRKADDEPPLS